MKAEIVQYYSRDDEHFGGDYCAVDVIIDGKLIKKYGDHYHEKGRERAEGFVDGLKFLKPDIEVLFRDDNTKYDEDGMLIEEITNA